MPWNRGDRRPRAGVHDIPGAGHGSDCRPGRSTTSLDTATTALEAAGYRVLGTSTSGQAARTLGTEAGVEARTLASLPWRLSA
ncbi:MAG: AAA family ATPase [Microthrixaceae bacterium]|nr:AAA family ATPase [Microthrixaceae bacterium]